VCRRTGPLSDLHDHYVAAVNRAVAADRPDLVAALEQEYVERGLELLLDG
jgi:hypothetical protein